MAEQAYDEREICKKQDERPLSREASARQVTRRMAPFPHKNTYIYRNFLRGGGPEAF